MLGPKCLKWDKYELADLVTQNIFYKHDVRVLDQVTPYCEKPTA